LESVHYNDGDTIIKQGDVGNNFYLIESGEATVLKTNENGVEREVNLLTKGGYFGGMFGKGKQQVIFLAFSSNRKLKRRRRRREERGRGGMTGCLFCFLILGRIILEEHG